MQKINFAFIRHGYGCHNAVGPLIDNGVINKRDFLRINPNNLVDPELTQIGVDATIQNGCIVSNVLHNSLEIPYMNVVVSSPLIRSMETAFFMTRTWTNPPETIYVMPHLREVNERAHGKNIFSNESFKIMEMTPEYAMKDINEQREYLRSKGLLQYFDFSFVEQYAYERKQAGHIQTFIPFFVRTFMSGVRSLPNPLNVLVITHHGVLRNYSGESYHNNSGFVLNTKLASGNVVMGDMMSLTKHLPRQFFKNFKMFQHKDYYCPSQRCGQICSIVNKSKASRKLKRADVGDCKTDFTFEPAYQRK